MKTLIAIGFGLCFSTAVSSQNPYIKVYFTRPIDNNISLVADGQYISNMEDSVCAYIDRAVSTIDIAVYDNNSSKIVSRMNAAYARGVRLRYISTDAALNTALSGLNANIPVLKRSGLDVMHNKFLIIDAADADKALVWTGSMNFTEDNMTEDPNNVVIIKNQALAQAYTTEFEEMWGSNTANYNATNAKFGADKTDNTPHSFNIGGTTVNLYFSPSDGTTTQIVNAINSCHSSMQFGVFTFINNDLGDAVNAQQDAGRQVKGIIENINYWGSEYSGLLANGVDVLSHDAIPTSFHHKYGIVDATNTASQPVVITGSHNWTNSAEEDYDENTLLIYDSYTANEYYEEFMSRYNEMTGTATHSAFLNEIQIYPNPVMDKLFIDNVKNIEKIYIFNILGQKQDFTILGEGILQVSHLAAGVYWLQVNADGKCSTFEFVRE